MPSFPAPIESRLPNVGTTIFTVMSRLAQECGAINLSQGFPDFNADDLLFERVAHWMRAGHNQYAPMAGCLPLREAIAAKVEALYGARYDVEHEITVTAGATQALFTAVTACVRPGDEVIVFEPVYDSYAPAIELAGGKVVRMRLAAPDYRPDWDAVAAANTISPSGNVRVGSLYPMVPVNSTVQKISDLETVPIRPGVLPSVFLRDLGAVEDSADITTGFALVNGRRAKNRSSSQTASRKSWPPRKALRKTISSRPGSLSP